MTAATTADEKASPDVTATEDAGQPTELSAFEAELKAEAKRASARKAAETRRANIEKDRQSDTVSTDELMKSLRLYARRKAMCQEAELIIQKQLGLHLLEPEYNQEGGFNDATRFMLRDGEPERIAKTTVAKALVYARTNYSSYVSKSLEDAMEKLNIPNFKPLNDTFTITWTATVTREQMRRHGLSSQAEEDRIDGRRLAERVTNYISRPQYHHVDVVPDPNRPADQPITIV